MKDIPNNFYNLDIYGKSSKRPYNPRGKMFGYQVLGFGSGDEFDFTKATQRGIFGFGFSGSFVGITNLVNNLGAVASDVSAVGTARRQLRATGFGGDLAIFFGGIVSPGGNANASRISNLVNNSGVVQSDVAN